MVTEQDVQQAFEAQQESGNEFLKGSRRAMAKAMELAPDCGAGEHHRRSGLAPLAPG